VLLWACFGVSFVHFGCHWSVYLLMPDTDGNSEDRLQTLVLLIFCGLGFASVGVCWQLFTREFFSFVVDEDQITRAASSQRVSVAANEISAAELPGRRDGLFNAIKLNAFIAGAGYFPLFLFFFDFMGYDSSADSRGDAQNMALQSYVCAWYNVIMPLFLVVMGIAIYKFPLRGEQLKYVKKRYSNVFDASKRDASRKSYAVKDATPPQAKTETPIDEIAVQPDEAVACQIGNSAD